MTKEKIMTELLMKLNCLEKEELFLINCVTASYCVHQEVKKAIHDNNVQQLQNLFVN